MVGSRKLSNDEVEALLGGLEGDDEQAVAKQFDPNEVREFTFGSEDLSLLGDYYALRMINEKMFTLRAIRGGQAKDQRPDADEEKCLLKGLQNPRPDHKYENLGLPF